MNLQNVERIFCGFRIATMSDRQLLRRLVGNDGVTFDVESDVIDKAAIGVCGDTISWIAPETQVRSMMEGCEVVHGHNRLLTPGLIDCHTHVVHGGSRADEWQQRLGGVSYSEIANRGGGILSTVRATREATDEDLMESALQRLDCMLETGVTTVEIKSGYGLDLETELRMLRVARQIGSVRPVSIRTTLLAAHAVPPEYAGRKDAYIDFVCQKVIPAAAERCDAVDAFCESIAFDVRQTTKVLETAIKHGLAIKVHSEQLSWSGMSVAAARLGALSVDHIEFLKDDECGVLAEHGTVATLLPGAFYVLRETQVPPVAALRKAGVAMAVATDCNPGSSPVVNLLTVAHMACTMFGLTIPEAWGGITRNAARALGLQDKCGEVRAGCRADFAIWEARSPAEVLYTIGMNRCHSIYRGGRLVMERGTRRRNL